MTKLIDDWQEARCAWAAADAIGRPVRECNRLMDRILELNCEIARDQTLHPRITTLCEPGVDPDTRLGAALVREHWDVDGAAATLVDIIERSGASITRPATMTSALAVRTTSAARSAALCLYNIDRGTGNIGGPQRG